MIIKDKAIKFLQSISDEMQPLYLGNSFGKDSIVIERLAKLAGIKYHSYHTNTTLDPKGTLSFGRKYYPETEILQPNESFYELVKRKGLPTRLNRYCCDILKEYGSIGRNVIEGIRSEESRKRKDRDYIQCDSRKKQKGSKHIYPIYDWTEKEVWKFIALENLEVAPAYQNGFTRLGCVGCPMVSKKGVRVAEFQREPKKLIAITNAIKIGMENNPQWKLSKLTKGNENIAIEWWLSGKTMNEFFNGQIRIFKDDIKFN